MANLDSPLDRLWNQLGDTPLTMSVKDFPDWVGRPTLNMGGTVPQAVI